MDFILGLHSLVRWLVVVAAVIAVVRYVIDLVGKSPDAELGRKLMMAYTILLDVNVLLGDHSARRAGDWRGANPADLDRARGHQFDRGRDRAYLCGARQEAGRRQAHGGMAAGGCGDFDRADRDGRGAHRRLVVGRTSWRENAQKQRM